MDEALSNPDGSKTLNIVPFEKGFHFTTDKDVYTGITATSLTEFAAKLETIDETSVQFHYPRGDFQKWIQATLGDKELADRLCFVERNLTGEKLRGQLLEIVQKRLSELQKQLEMKTQPSAFVGEMGGENVEKAKKMKPSNVQDIINHLGDVEYPVTGKEFVEACDNMSDVGKEQRDWVKMNIDVKKTYNSPDEIKKALGLGEMEKAEEEKKKKVYYAKKEKRAQEVKKK